jgi:undecaprenyl phosphate N,N'-diacetylbacillosamine 1-phosphate transferase
METLKSEYGLAQADVMEITNPKEMIYKRHVKRGLDLAAGIVLIAVLSPVMLLTALCCLWGFRGKVFFIQERLGLGCRKFRVYKFKTMSDDCDAEGHLLPDEQRVNRLGRILRSLSLDELPQLINVVKGDMSLIGPRPLVEEQVAHCTEEQLRRYEVRPGITGLAQVSGRNGIPFERRFRYDVWYVRHLSPGLDSKVLLMTVRVLLGIDAGKNVIDNAPQPKHKPDPQPEQKTGTKTEPKHGAKPKYRHDTPADYKRRSA